MRTLLIGLVALAFGLFGAPQVRADIVTIHDTIGLPDPNPAWVDGGQPMSVRFNLGPGGGWIASGIRITIDQPTEIHTLNGVMATFGSAVWTSAHWELNVHSSESQFGASALVGDVYHADQGIFVSNLEGGQPPAWGGLNSSGNPNRWVEFGFESFVLQPGDYVLSLQAYVVGSSIAWTETLNDFGLQSDIATTSEMFPDWVERSSLSVYTTGNSAVLIQGTIIPAPSPALCLAFAAAGMFGGRRRVACSASKKQTLMPACFSQHRC